MEDKQLHVMLNRLYQHTKAMRKWQLSMKIMNTKYDKTMARKFEQLVDKEISNIDMYLRGTMTPPAPHPS